MHPVLWDISLTLVNMPCLPVPRCSAAVRRSHLYVGVPYLVYHWEAQAYG